MANSNQGSTPIIEPSRRDGYLGSVYLALRYLGVVGLAFWLGGMAFYGAVVIPTAHHILDSHRDIGFVTRQVTGTANLLGAAVLSVLFVHLAVVWKGLGQGSRITLGVSWFVMAAAQTTLFFLRTHLDSMLDPAALRVLDRPRFMPLHERYLNVTSVLCLAAVVHLGPLLRGASKPTAPAPPAA